MEPRVQTANCPECKQPIILAVIEGSLDKDVRKEFAKLMKEGFIIDTIDLATARKTELCINKKHWKKK